jgi:methyl-accepting chemotaxis protein
MESLVQSMLGKGQEHVLETMKTLIEDAARVNDMEVDLTEIKYKLDRLEDENQQHKKVIRDLKNDLGHEKDANEELEDELEGKEKEIKHLENCVKNRDDITNKLDDMFKEKTDEIRNLRENCDSLAKQVGKELLLENKLEIQNKVIKALKVNLKEVEETAKFSPVKDLEKLMSEIEHLEKENAAKVKQLDDVQTENEIFKEKLQFLQETNIELTKISEKTESNISLSEELSMVCKLGNTFECIDCEKDFKTNEDLASHVDFEHESWKKKEMKDQLGQFEIQINLQKLKLTEDMLELNIRESYEKEICRCKGKCKIIHSIYNWRKRYGQEFHSKLLNIKKQDSNENDALEKFSCNPWGLDFLSDSQLKNHIVTSH